MDSRCFIAGILAWVAGSWALSRLVVGPGMDALWRYVHGPERSERAREGILYVAAGWVTLCAIYLLARTGAPIGLFVLLALALSGAVVGMHQSLPPLGRDPAPRMPARCVQDHDGLQVSLTHQSALPVILIAGSFPLWPVMWLLAIVCAVLPRRTVTFRMRTTAVEVSVGHTKRAVSLHGLRVRQETSLVGTPEICLLQGEQVLRVGVGGHAPEEVAWVVEKLREAARHAPEVEVQQAPPATLRRMLAQGQRERS